MLPRPHPLRGRGSTPGWSCPDRAGPGTTCILDLGTLPAQSSEDATFAIRIDPPLPHGVESLTNTALLRDAGPPEIVDIPTLHGLGLAALALLLAAVAFRRLNAPRRTAR